MAIGVSNFATTTLGAAISTTSQGAQTVTLVSGSTFPSSGAFVIRVEDELILIDSRSGATLTVNPTSGRGFESTTPATHSNGSDVYGVMTAYSLENYIQEQAVDGVVGGQATGTVGAITVANTHGTSGTQTHHAEAHDLFSASHTGDLDNTDTPADVDLLQFDNAAGKWKAQPASAHGSHGAGGGGRVPYSAVIYRSGATYFADDSAGASISSGGTAHTVFNAAINAVNAAGGGNVFVTAANYTITSSIVMKSGVRLVGEGVGGRTPNSGSSMTTYGARLLAGGAGLTVISIPSGSPGCVIEAIAIDGNNQTTATGILGAGCGDCIITHTYVSACRTGIWIQGGGTFAKACRIEHSFVEGGGANGGAIYGIRVDGTGGGGTDAATDGGIHECRIIHIDAGATPSYGCYIAEGGWQLSDLHITMSRSETSTGVWANASPFQLVNSYLDSHGVNALRIAGNVQGTIGNNYFLWGPAAGSLVYIEGSGVLDLYGNRLRGGSSSGTARWGIEFQSNPTTGFQGNVVNNFGKNFTANGGTIGYNGIVVPNGIYRAHPLGEAWPYCVIDGNVQTQTV